MDLNLDMDLYTSWQDVSIQHEGIMSWYDGVEFATSDVIQWVPHLLNFENINNEFCLAMEDVMFGEAAVSPSMIILQQSLFWVHWDPGSLTMIPSPDYPRLTMSILSHKLDVTVDSSVTKLSCSIQSWKLKQSCLTGLKSMLKHKQPKHPISLQTMNIGGYKSQKFCSNIGFDCNHDIRRVDIPTFGEFELVTFDPGGISKYVVFYMFNEKENKTKEKL